MMAALAALRAMASGRCWPMIALSAAMTPLLWQPLTHVWDRSLSDRRLRAVLLFLSGYFAVRMMAIAVLAFCSIALRIATGGALAAFAAALGDRKRGGGRLCWTGDFYLIFAL